MRILIVCGRFPELGQKGDQLRARQQIDLLCDDHQISVLTAGRPSSPAAQRELEMQASLVLVPASRTGRIVSAIAAGVRGLPLEVGWMMPAGVRRRLASLAPKHDIVIASTVRCLADPLPAPAVLDHIDALSVNLGQRARLERNPLFKLGAGLEARLLARHERRLAVWVAAQTVVSALDALTLPQPPRPVVVPLVLARAPEPVAGAPRDIDVILTGNMGYPPNREAAEWLAGAIVPELRRRRAEVRVLVAGRGASRLQVTGVEIASDVPDLAELIRRARVAVVPLLSGTGVPNKLLEAVASGCAVVATTRAATAAGLDVDTADDADGFVTAIDRLLQDEELRISRAAAAGAGLERHRPDAVRAMLESIIHNSATSGRAGAADVSLDRYNP